MRRPEAVKGAWALRKRQACWVPVGGERGVFESACYMWGLTGF